LNKKHCQDFFLYSMPPKIVFESFYLKYWRLGKYFMLKILGSRRIWIQMILASLYYFWMFLFKTLKLTENVKNATSEILRPQYWTSRFDTFFFSPKFALFPKSF
jgi:hypothetical protein